MTTRKVFLGDYELIEGNWIGPVVAEGTVRLIEGKMYFASNFEKDDEYNPCTQRNGVKYSKWVQINIVADDSKE